MFVTVEEVNLLTGYSVTNDTIIKAQAIIESYTGRSESTPMSPDDRTKMQYATAYQAAYMFNNPNIVFEQYGATQMGQNNSQVSFGDKGIYPFIAPLAVLTLRRLSWRGSRSVQIGSTFGNTPVPAWETL